MNLAYQLDRHCAVHAACWPNASRADTRRQFRRLLVTGRAWMWPEPVQMDLFGGVHG